MAPFTRSHTREKLGAFTKGVIENPPIIDSIINHLQHSITDGGINRVSNDLDNLRLVFKNDSIVDVIRKHQNEVNNQIKRKGNFLTEMSNMMRKHQLLSIRNERMVNMDVIFDFCLVKNIDIVKLYEFKHFRTAFIKKFHEINKECPEFKREHGLKYSKIMLQI
jgi:hypothetical protein